MSEQENNEQRPQEIAGAITYPVQNEVSDGTFQQPRPARNMQDLLRYSADVAALGGPSASRNPCPLDEESKRFLNEALASMTTDVIAQLKTGIIAIENVLKSDYVSEEDCDSAFDNILDLVDKADFANDFHKIGGFRVFTPCLDSSNSLIKWRCCELIAELCQNNPYCQEQCLKEGYLQNLLNLIQSDPSELVQIKALYAVSCLVRESEEALKEFTAKNGFSILLQSLQSDSAKLKIKSSFLLSSLCSLNPQVKDELVSMGFVEQMIGLIAVTQTELSIVEHLLSALNALITDHEEAGSICRRTDLQLASILDSIMETSQGRPEAKEVVEYALAIKKIVSEDNCNLIEEDR